MATVTEQISTGFPRRWLDYEEDSPSVQWDRRTRRKCLLCFPFGERIYVEATRKRETEPVYTKQKVVY